MALATRYKSAHARIGDPGLGDKDAYAIGQYNWFGAGPEKVIGGYEAGANGLFQKSLNRYQDLQYKWAERRELMKDLFLQKAFTTTVGQYLIPTYLDPGLIDLTRQNTPFIALLRRETMIGLTANIQQIATTNVPIWQTEGGTLDDQDESFDRVTYAVKYGYSVGSVTGPQVMASQTYIDSRQTSVNIHGVALRRLEEKTALLGSNTATPPDPCVYDANGYDGIFKLINENTGTYGNETDKGGTGSIVLQDIRDSIETVLGNGGKPSLILTDLHTYNTMKAEISAFERHVDQTEIAWGMPSYTIDTIPVIWSHTLPRTTTNRSALVLDMDVLCMNVLQDITYEKMAKTIDADKFMLKVYEVFTDKSSTKFHASIRQGL